MTLEAQTADFDRILSSMIGLPDTKITKPRPVQDIYPMLHERNATFVVQTHRAKNAGFTVFVQIVDAQGSRRIVLPPKVSAAIYAQRQSLTDRSTPESRARKAKANQRKKQKVEREARRVAFATRNGHVT